MNGNPSASYAQLRRGELAGPDFSFFKQQAGYNPINKSKGPNSQSSANIGSGPFNILSDDVKTGEVASLDKNRMGGVYGANAASASRPITPLGTSGE